MSHTFLPLSRASLRRPLRALGLAAAAALALASCGDKEPEIHWLDVDLPEAGLKARFPCPLQRQNVQLDFGLGNGPVQVHAMGCDDAVTQSTFALSHWVLDDASQADEALAFWQVQVLDRRLRAVDGGKGDRSGGAFLPKGAMTLPRSVRVTMEGRTEVQQGSSKDMDWNISAHGVWFARREGEKARIFHAIIYSPKPIHKVASQFFNSFELTDSPMRVHQQFEQMQNQARDGGTGGAAPAQPAAPGQ